MVSWRLTARFFGQSMPVREVKPVVDAEIVENAVWLAQFFAEQYLHKVTVGGLGLPAVKKAAPIMGGLCLLNQCVSPSL